MPGSPNKNTVTSLLATVKNKDSKLFDALTKMEDDIDKCYRGLFDGLLPATSGRLLDLTEIPEAQLPAYIAFLDTHNEFIENQQVSKLFPIWDVKWDDHLGGIASGKIGRFMQIADGTTLFSSNLYYDGAAWQTDSGDGSGIQFLDDEISLIQFTGGFEFLPLVIGHDHIIRIGEPSFYTDSNAYDTVFDNNKFLRATDSTGLRTLPMMGLDANNLVELGSNTATSGNPNSGEGNISIPRDTGVNLPTAGATRNGILIINKTTPRLCFYVNGLRYFCAGTAF